MATDDEEGFVCHVCGRRVKRAPIVLFFSFMGRAFELAFCSSECFAKFLKTETDSLEAAAKKINVDPSLLSRDKEDGESYIG